MPDQNNYQPQDPQQGYQQQPVQQQQYQQQYQQPVYQQPYQQQYAQPGVPAKSATALIVLSVLEFLFLGGLLAIIPFVFALQASSAYRVGDVVNGDAKARISKISLIIIAVLGIVLYIALFALGGLAILYANS